MPARRRNWKSPRLRSLGVERLEDRRVFSVAAGDVNLDGAVNLSDFNVIKSRFGEVSTGRLEGDLDADNVVTLSDFALLKASFGETSLVETYPFPSFAQLASRSHGALRNRIDVPKVTPLAAPADPAEGLALRSETVDLGHVVRTYEYYPDGGLYSEYYHENGAKTIWRQDGTKFASFEPGRRIAFYYDALGRKLRSVQDDGTESRFAYYLSGATAVEQKYVASTLVGSKHYQPNGDLLMAIDYQVVRDAGGEVVNRGNWTVYYPSGSVQLVVDPDYPHLLQVYDDTAAPGETTGRRIVWGDFAKEWYKTSYWGATDIEHVRQYWEGAQFLYADVFDEAGNLLYRERSPETITTDPVSRDASGKVEALASNEVLSFLNIPNEWLLASTPDLSDVLWIESFRINVSNPAGKANGWEDALDRYQELVDNARRHNPHLAVSSYYSYFAAPEAEMRAQGTFPYRQIPVEEIPQAYRADVVFVTDQATPAVSIDFENPAARAWLTQHLIDEGLGRGGRPKLDALFVDSVAVDLDWRYRVEVLSAVKKALNAEGVRLHLNIGGHPFTTTTAYVAPNLYDDLASMADTVMIESPWRRGQRDVKSTLGAIDSIRKLMDRGLAVEFLAADYLHTSQISGKTEPTTVPSAIKSIHETTAVVDGNAIPALRVATDQPHHIFPTAGGDGTLIELVDLPAGYEAWQGRYRPLPVAGAKDQVLLVATHPDTHLTVLGRDLTAPGGAYLFDHGQIRRLMAAWAMMIRRPGDPIAVSASFSRTDLPGAGEPDNIDNWAYWPSIFGKPTGDVSIDQTSGDQVVRISREFERGGITIYPQTGEVVTRAGPNGVQLLLELRQQNEAAKAAMLEAMGANAAPTTAPSGVEVLTQLIQEERRRAQAQLEQLAGRQSATSQSTGVDLLVAMNQQKQQNEAMVQAKLAELARGGASPSTSSAEEFLLAFNREKEAAGAATLDALFAEGGM